MWVSTLLSEANKINEKKCLISNMLRKMFQNMHISSQNLKGKQTKIFYKVIILLSGFKPNSM